MQMSRDDHTQWESFLSNDEDMGEDIEHTDEESESESEVSESDKAFIDSQEDFYELGDYDPDYHTEDENISSSASSSDNETSIPWQIGDGEISVLDEREIEGGNGAVTQLLISCWVEERVMREILKLLSVSNREGVD
ncbi:hypothetical protein AARAC_010806 [Aspergillus arachidicola]|uniref:Uncharacterized protein n=1 Tax=Aspergillus arachidicola TaxID=656916 RepID=A0A2G7G9M1_9EURO|nr:hypothetical protein AARAC_010806 [Aspergillus arachidicola]